MSEVMVLKLVSGEELIATKTGDEFYEKVRIFYISPNGQAGLVPWVMINPDGEFTIKDSHIMAKFPAPVEIEKSYLSATSGLILG